MYVDLIILYKQFNFGLVPQTFGLVTLSNSLPEGQPHFFIFVSPCVYLKKYSFSFLSNLTLRKNIAISQSVFFFFLKSLVILGNSIINPTLSQCPALDVPYPPGESMASKIRFTLGEIFPDS